MELDALKLSQTVSSNKTKMHTNDPTLSLRGASIEQVSSYKYVGIWLDEVYTFKTLIKNLTKKIKPKNSSVELSPLAFRKNQHFTLFTYKALLGMLPLYLTNLLIQSTPSHGTISQNKLLFKVPKTNTKAGGHCFLNPSEIRPTRLISYF